MQGLRNDFIMLTTIHRNIKLLLSILVGVTDMSVKFQPKNHPREYRTWAHMKGRCYCKTDPKYSSYGGRGIGVCDRWIDDFSQFYEDMGDKPVGKLSIDRIDNDGNYCKENCRWATARQQANNRRSSHLLTYKGETKTIAQWSRETGIKQFTLRARIEVSGMSVEEALETSVITPYRGKFTHNGITDTITGWSLRLGFKRNTLNERMRRGLSFDDAVRTPLTANKDCRAGLQTP